MRKCFLFSYWPKAVPLPCLWFKYAACLKLCKSGILIPCNAERRCTELKHCMVNDWSWVKVCHAWSRICVSFSTTRMYAWGVATSEHTMHGQAHTCTVVVPDTSGVELRQRLRCAWPRKVKIVLRWLMLTWARGWNWGPENFSHCGLIYALSTESCERMPQECLAWSNHFLM